MEFCDCGEPVLAARSDAEFCSSACRQRAYRRRKKILDEHGTWENVLSHLVEESKRFGVTDSDSDSRNA